VDADHDADPLTAEVVTPGAARFDGTAYARATAHHRAHDDATLAGLSLSPGMRVLDLGCGVGDLTADVARRVDAGGDRGGWVLGVDASPSCVAVASARARPGLSFLVARAQDVGRVLGAPALDAVLSVAVLHWVPRQDQAAVLAGVAQLLRPSGVLRADLGGQGQIAGVRAALVPLAVEAGAPQCPWFFPSAVEMGALAVEAGLVVDEVRTVRQRRSVPDADALSTWLVSQVLPAYLAHVPDGDHDAFTAEALRVCRAATRRDDGSYDQDYVRIHLLAAKRSRGPAAGADDLPADYALVADVLASTASEIEVAGADDDRKALWSKRLRRLVASSRRDPAGALDGLAALRDAMRHPSG
jgi:ubiquinone/menaquinone biosynthesis C-methylase UbiE